jgi:hypothetical protein
LNLFFYLFSQSNKAEKRRQQPQTPQSKGWNLWKTGNDWRGLAQKPDHPASIRRSD